MFYSVIWIKTLATYKKNVKLCRKKHIFLNFLLWFLVFDALLILNYQSFIMQIKRVSVFSISSLYLNTLNHF